MTDSLDNKFRGSILSTSIDTIHVVTRCRKIRNCIQRGREGGAYYATERQRGGQRDGKVEERVGRFNEEIDPTSIQDEYVSRSVKIELCPWPIRKVVIRGNSVFTYGEVHTSKAFIL